MLFDSMFANIIFIIAIIAILGAISVLVYNIIAKTDIQDSTSDPKVEEKYKNQVKLLSDRYNPLASARRPVTDLLATGIIDEQEQCLVNFYSLGCRYTGYIGPMNEGYWDPDLAVQLAVNSGCRTFVLEIDYLDECDD